MSLISASGQIEERDYLRAQYLHMKSRPFMRAVGVIVLLLFGFGLALGVRDLARGRFPQLTCWFRSLLSCWARAL